MLHDPVWVYMYLMTINVSNQQIDLSYFKNFKVWGVLFDIIKSSTVNLVQPPAYDPNEDEDK